MIALPNIPPPATEAERTRIAERLAMSSVRNSGSAPALQFKPVQPNAVDLSQSFLDAHRMSSQTRGSTVMYSALVHGLILAAVLLIPMWFANTLDIQMYTRTLLVAPPPPPPAPAPAAPSAAAVHAASPTPRHQIIAKGQLLLPTYIPKHVAAVDDSQEAPEVGGSGGVPGGVAGGIPGGILGGILGAGLTEVSPAPVPAVPAPAALAGPRAPLHVGGEVKAPRAIYTPQPEYPVLARQARMEGIVQIDAVIDEHGNVIKMHAVSGPGLLIPAALDTVSKWKYEPTYLNGEPYPIALTVHVTFHMGFASD